MIESGQKDMAVWIDEWIEKEKVMCIAEDTEDKKKGWYWKPKEGEGDQAEWLKSPIPGIKIIDGVVEQLKMEDLEVYYPGGGSS